MILSHYDIKSAFDLCDWQAHRDGERIYSDSLRINPNSVNVTLGRKFLYPLDPSGAVDPHDADSLQWVSREADEIILNPGVFILAHVRERFSCAAPLMIQDAPRRFVQMIEGRSTLARCGLQIHATAGFGDFGFASNFTLELSTHIPIVLRAGDEIGQVYFLEASCGAMSYKGAYTEQHDEPRAPQLGRERFRQEVAACSK